MCVCVARRIICQESLELLIDGGKDHLELLMLQLVSAAAYLYVTHISSATHTSIRACSIRYLFYSNSPG